MFGLSWDQLILILLAALFLLGPERIPTAIRWLMDSLRRVRTMAAGAQAELRSQIGPELDELRRQVAELQSLKELGELRGLRELSPRRIIGKNILGDEFSGGMTGLLGLGSPGGAPAGGPERAPGAAPGNAATIAADGGPARGEADSGGGAGRRGTNGAGAMPTGEDRAATAALATAPMPAEQGVADGAHAVRTAPPFDDEGT